MRLLVSACLCLCLAAAAAACGTRRAKPPSLDAPQSPEAYKGIHFPSADLRLKAPTNWFNQPGSPPLVTTLTSGTATVAVWRYPRSEPLPADPAALEDARAALIDAAQARDRTLRIASSRVVRVGSAQGVELQGTETIGGTPRQVRSTHLYEHGAEIVIDAFAPPSRFAQVDRRVFTRLLASIRLEAPASAGRRS